jgi:hypothetical protein
VSAAKFEILGLTAVLDLLQSSSQAGSAAWQSFALLKNDPRHLLTFKRLGVFGPPHIGFSYRLGVSFPDACCSFGSAATPYDNLIG